MRQAKGSITIVAHVGAASTEEAVALARHAAGIGIPYVSAISPWYYRHDKRAVVGHFRALVEAVNMPVYVYNNPQATSVVVTGPMLRHLNDVGVRGIKDSSFNYMASLKFTIPQSVPLYLAGTLTIAPAACSSARACRTTWASSSATTYPSHIILRPSRFIDNYNPPTSARCLASSARSSAFMRATLSALRPSKRSESLGEVFEARISAQSRSPK